MFWGGDFQFGPPLYTKPRSYTVSCCSRLNAVSSILPWTRDGGQRHQEDPNRYFSRLIGQRLLHIWDSILVDCLGTDAESFSIHRNFPSKQSECLQRWPASLLHLRMPSHQSNVCILWHTELAREELFFLLVASYIFVSFLFSKEHSSFRDVSTWTSKGLKRCCWLLGASGSPLLYDTVILL